jgi:hypothetical protein
MIETTSGFDLRIMSKVTVPPRRDWGQGLPFAQFRPMLCTLVPVMAIPADDFDDDSEDDGDRDEADPDDDNPANYEINWQ